MVKRRPLKGFDNDSSSSEEENDAFATLGNKGKKRTLASALSNDDTDKISRQESNAGNNGSTNNDESSALPAVDTSSNKRHHHLSAARKSKMDAMLFELQTSQQQPITDHHDNNTVDYGRIDDEAAYSYSYGRPNKLGSYVEPGQEHLTTNIFVGNLDPCTTEEELTDVFREYGEAMF